MKPMFVRLIRGVVAILMAIGGLSVTATPAEAAPKTSTHCGRTAAWTAAFTRKLSKNVSLTFRGADLGQTTLICPIAKRKTAKKSYLSMAFNGHPGKYTAGKSIKRLLVIPRGEVGTVVLRLFTKKNGITKTTWAKTQYFA